MKLPDLYTSIVIASYVPDELRAKMLRTSIYSLIKTTRKLPVEIIVVDNGGHELISTELQALAEMGDIHTYIMNSSNMHFGFARNQGIAMAHGKYLCIADNDIAYTDGWLEECLAVLEAYPLRKFWATPIDYPLELNGRRTVRYDAGEVEVNAKTYKLSRRAGSNCFVISRKNFEEVGMFENHRIAGSVWNDLAVRSGFVGAVNPTCLVTDLGLRMGYNHKKPLPVRRILTNGEVVYFNEDEYVRPS